MNRGGKIFAILILILVALFGIGQFFAFSNVNTAPTSQTSQPPPASVPATQVITYIPPQPATSTPVENGSCFAGSIAAPYRSDAWRCSVGNAISDPCFEISGVSGTPAGNLLCGINPAAQTGVSTSTFVLHLTKPLPKASIPGGAVPLNWAWAVQLIDGSFCTPFSGTRPFTASGTVGYYACSSPNPSETMIFGDLDASNTTWIAQVGSLAASTSSLPTLQYSAEVPVSVVWQ